MKRSKLSGLAGVCLLAGLGLALVGCSVDRGPSPTEQAQAQFQQGDYMRAQVTASRAATTAGGHERDLAHYLAGISAYRMQNLDTAERYLRVAAHSGDESMAADARSTLGLIYSRQGRYSDAADALLRSANLQAGEDRAQAFFYAGVAQQKLGRWPQARTSLLLAKKSTRDAGLVSRINQQLAVTGYTIQVGAFVSRANADKLASSYVGRAAAGKLGSVFVTPGVGSDGRAFNLVQVGRFTTFGSASAARGVLGDSNAVIVPLQR
jgi:tetratricopeptide (TPR) repeat protein